MDEPLRSGNRPKPQHWKSDGSTEVEETSAEEDQDWNDDSNAGWTIDSEGHYSLSGGSVCALVASDGQASLRRSISETDLLVAGFEESERERCSLWHALHCLALHRVVSETCALFAVNAFWATLSGRVATVSTVLVSQRGSECRYRARGELPLMQQWPRGRADDRVTLPADLETMDLLVTATSQPTLRAAEPRRRYQASQ